MFTKNDSHLSGIFDVLTDAKDYWTNTFSSIFDDDVEAKEYIKEDEGVVFEEVVLPQQELSISLPKSEQEAVKQALQQDEDLVARMTTPFYLIPPSESVLWRDKELIPSTGITPLVPNKVSSTGRLERIEQNKQEEIVISERMVRPDKEVNKINKNEVEILDSNEAINKNKQTIKYFWYFVGGYFIFKVIRGK